MSAIFDHNIEYPRVAQLLDNGLEPGVLYEYVSSSFMNGILPYLEIVRAVLLERYRGDGSSGDHRRISDHEIEQVLSQFHTCLGDFGDDVLVVGATPEFWWFIHLDCDVSDCRIGRISRVEHPTVDALTQWVDSYINNSKSWWALRAELPATNLRGWIQF